MSEALEQTIEDLRLELRGTQEMLAFVLFEVGEPVVVTKAQLMHGLPSGAQIVIDENVEEEVFVFRLVEGEDEDSVSDG